LSNEQLATATIASMAVIATMKAKINHLSPYQHLGVIVTVHLLLSLPGLWVPYFNIDELTNALYARFINAGMVGLKDFLGSTYLLTHYLYALVYSFTEKNNMLPMHIVHTFWQAGTIGALYGAGSLLGNKKTGLWAAWFYCVFAHGFLSKDFYTPSAESLSLFPAVLCAIFVIRAFKNRATLDYLLVGVFAAIAASFKAPMACVLLAAVLAFLIGGGFCLRGFLALGFGFVCVIILPVCLVEPFGSGFGLMRDKFTETNTLYIQAYEGFSFLYWFIKFVIRTTLVLSASFAMTVFAVYGIRPVFRLGRFKSDDFRHTLFLFLWLVLLWFTIALGKRVFYHYFVFLLGPLSLLAAEGVRFWDERQPGAAKRVSRGKIWLLATLGHVRKHMVLLMALPASLFFIEAACNFSTMPNDVTSSIEYVKQHTSGADRIYIWGNVPQLYFYSERLPSTAYFWSDVLAGTSPGSPAMEYVRATNRNLNVQTMLMKDFQPHVFGPQENDFAADSNHLTGISETELFTVAEILERIDHPYWKKVFADFLTRPPTLFIDSSPANIRGFGYFPIEKYELLKRFVEDNYRQETVVDGMIVYRLRSAGRL